MLRPPVSNYDDAVKILEMIASSEIRNRCEPGSVLVRLLALGDVLVVP